MNIRSTCKYNFEHVFKGEATQGLIRDIKNHERTCLNDPVDIMRKLKELQERIGETTPPIIDRLITNIKNNAADSDSMKLAKEIIAEGKKPDGTSSLNLRINSGWAPFQCFDNLQERIYEDKEGNHKRRYELYPSKRFVLLREDAKDIENMGFGWIVE